MPDLNRSPGKAGSVFRNAAAPGLHETVLEALLHPAEQVERRVPEQWPSLDESESRSGKCMYPASKNRGVRPAGKRSSLSRPTSFFSMDYRQFGADDWLPAPHFECPLSLTNGTRFPRAEWKRISRRSCRLKAKRDSGGSCVRKKT